MGEEPGGHAVHVLGPTLVHVNGNRALADTGCTILMRRAVGGVECDLTSYCRHHSRVERHGNGWRLRTLVGVYENNTLAPVVPAGSRRSTSTSSPRYSAATTTSRTSGSSRASRCTTTGPTCTVRILWTPSTASSRGGWRQTTSRSGWVELTEAPSTPTEVDVVGAGLAGHAVVLAAAEAGAGASVLLLEEARYGGSSTLAGGGSSSQER